MKVRLALAAAALALGVSAFTPTPAAAAPPSGNVLCLLADGTTTQLFPFGTGAGTVRGALLNCFTAGGVPLRIVLD